MAYYTKTQLAEMFSKTNKNPKDFVRQLLAHGHKLEGLNASPGDAEITVDQNMQTKGAVGKIGSFLGIEKFGRWAGSQLAKIGPGGTEHRATLNYLKEMEKKGIIEAGISKRIATGDVSNKEAIASGLMTAANLILAGAGSKILGMTAKGGEGLLTKIGKSALVGGTMSGIGAVEKGGGTKQAIKSAAIGAGIGAGFTLAMAGAGALAKRFVSAISGKPIEVIETAYKNPSAAMKGRKTTLEAISKQGRNVVKQLKTDLNKNYGTQANEIYSKIGAQRITEKTKLSLIKKATSVLDDFGIQKEGKKLAWGKSAIARTAEQKNIQQAYGLLESWDDITPKGLNTLKQKIGGLTKFDTAKTTRSSAVVNKIYNVINQKIKTKIPELTKISSEYANKMKFIERADEILASYKGGKGLQTTINKLAGLFGKNKEYSRSIIAELDRFSGTNIIDQVAGKTLFQPQSPFQLDQGGLMSIIRPVAQPITAAGTIAAGHTLPRVTPVTREAVYNVIRQGANILSY